MRKITLLALLSLLAVPMYAARGQSYFTYDDGETVIRQSDDGRQVDARVNMPVYPGDEVTTSRRGRVEIRLSDGNVLGIDRASQVRFKSILDSYEGDSEQTVVELRYGHVVLQRTGDGGDFVRLDTESASYVATDEAIYAIDSDRGKDRIIVFDGAVEVRTPQRTSRVRAGETAKIDEQGLYGLVNDSVNNADEFERWFLRRAERYGRGSSRYLDSSLSYADADLTSNGSWVFVGGFNTWCWRPHVAVGWRPYYYGEWVSGPSGCLVWVSYEPWGWVPYHYGRWAYDPLYGWVWMPGTGYSPAWVYWMYGSGYVGWAPAGWWDCYKPYYNWCYRPYSRASWDVGWFGRMRTGDIDFRPWTFVRPGEIVGVRVDRAAATTDAVRERLLRNGGGDGGGYTTVSTSPARFTRNELRDPANAVNNIIRRTNGGGTNAPDMTPFMRRDANVTTNVREHILRNRGGDGNNNGGFTTGSLPSSGGTTAGGGSTIGRTGTIGGNSGSGIGSGSGVDGRVRRGDAGGSTAETGASTGTIDRGTVRRGDGSGSTSGTPGATSGDTNRGRTGSGGGWRDGSGGLIRRGDNNNTTNDRDSNGRVSRGGSTTDPGSTPATTVTPTPSDSWRGRSVRGGSGDGGSTSSGGDSSRGRSGDRGNSSSGNGSSADRDRGSSIPRRIIDAIGGPRIYHGGDSGSSRGSRDSGSSSSGGGSSSSGGGSRGGERSSPPPPPPPPPSSNSGNSGDSGRVHRDQ